MYGRGATSIAEQIGGTLEDAQAIIDDFYRSFPKVKKWMDKTLADAKANGYVEDLWGRRRRLPDILLEKYEISSDKESNIQFNPLLECENRIDRSKDKNIKKYLELLESAKGRREVNKIISEAAKADISIKDNNGFIAQAERQCVNARIQGGAASMTKLAMIKLHNDKILRDLGFKLLIGVHDELIGECPAENAEEAAERLTYVMRTAAEGVVEVPFKCDPDIASCWYLNDYQDLVRKEFLAYIKEGYSKEEAFNLECADRPESTVEQMHETLDHLLLN